MSASISGEIGRNMVGHSGETGMDLPPATIDDSLARLDQHRKPIRIR